MKKLLLALIFLPAISFAANWVYVTESPSGYKYKVDSSSIVRNGNEVTFWEMVNMPTRNDFGELSSKNQVTINCLTKEYTPKFMEFFSDFDAKGTSTNKYKPTVNNKWRPISPDGVYDSVMKFVCKR